MIDRRMDKRTDNYTITMAKQQQHQTGNKNNNNNNSSGNTSPLQYKQQ